MKTIKYILAVLVISLLLAGCDITGKAASDFGTLEITSEPDAVFYVNGDHRGETPRSTLLSPGTYTIKVSKPNYYDYETKVTIKAKETININARLTQLENTNEGSFGKFTIETEPKGATVLLNGEERGQTPLVLEKIAIGDYAVRIFNTGYYDHSTDKNIKLGPNSLSIELKELGIAPTELNYGTLSIESDPTESFIFIDGMYKEKTPREINLIAGEHVLRVARGGFKDYVNTVNIGLGETTEISVELKKTGLSS